MAQSHAYQPIRNVHHMDIETSDRSDPVPQPTKSNKYLLGFLGLIVAAILSFTAFLFFDGTTVYPSPSSKSTAQFDVQGRFVMKNFDTAKPMSDFLNGLGGLWGVPMWAFYVNRGQAIASFGRQNKDGGIQKFSTAEKAYQQTQFTGFRTFVKGERAGNTFTHMPFFPRSLDGGDDAISRDLMIGANEMEIEEVEPTIGLKTNVVYFTVPDEDYPSLVRSTTFTNLDPTAPLQLDVLDGLAKLIPAGLNNWGLDAMGRTLEAYMRVYNVGSAATNGGGIVTEPFYHATQSTADTARVSLIKDGEFVVSFIDEGDDVSKAASDGLFAKLPFIVDPSIVFDTDTSLMLPRAFFSKNEPVAADLNAFMQQPQGTTARTPCAFAGARLTIQGGKSVTITSVYGHADNLQSFVGSISPKVRTPGYIAKKRSDAQALVEGITKSVTTSTSSRIFDDYIQQDYLDNILRGGIPLTLGDTESPKIFHTFSRIHGDIERDYNDFQIDTTYFSQGPGNFRDVSQNRRLDVLLEPEVKDFNVRMFLSFVQADAYNPLTVASTLFKVPADAVNSLMKALQVEDYMNSGVPAKAVKAALSNPFRPGQFFQDMSNAGVTFGIDREEVLNKIVAASKQYFAAKFAQNGFWADHWTYTLDLVNNYLAVYPDKEEYLLWDAEPVPFFLSPATVLPRQDRYSLVDNPEKPGTSTIRVYKPLSIWGEPDFNGNLSNELLAIMAQEDYVGDATGAGGVWMRNAKDGSTFRVSIGAKLLMLGVLKFSTMDPYGMGVEMEGGKPGWNDAMNGLPGIMGSGMPETYEMLQILKFMNSAFTKHHKSIELPIEFVDFLSSMEGALKAFETASAAATSSLPEDVQKLEFLYWDASNTAREIYRRKVAVNFAGVTKKLDAAYIISLLTSMEAKVAKGIQRALDTNNGHSPTYFSYECTEYTILPVSKVSIPAEATKVAPTSFVQHTLPLFLEGPTRHMKTISTVEGKRDVYTRTRGSKLFDAPLQMYTLSESLKSIGPDVGRMVAFSPGWLENESVWLHMSYKFYLELLRGGLYEEFFAEIATGLVPFMDSAVYARSPLEAASFIVSSAFPDKKLHGQGFLARLSGSTAEFLSMWTIMFAGPQPFSLDMDGNLQLSFQPILPGWLFPENSATNNGGGDAAAASSSTVSFTFLGDIQVTYNNPSRKDTWRIQPTSGSMLGLDGQVYTTNTGVFNKEHALMVRKQKISSITINY